MIVVEYIVGILKQCIHNNNVIPYIASSDGSIYNMNMKKMKASIQNSGYQKVDLHINSKPKTVLVHRLIAETFISNPNNFPVVNHIDGNKNNNSVDNLEWTTYSYNNKHAYDNNLKLSLKGKDSPFAKYKESDIHKICKYLEIYESPKKICKLINLPLSLIKSIKSGLSWTNISKDYNIIKPRYSVNKELRKIIYEYCLKGNSIKDIIYKIGWPYTPKYIKKVNRAIKRLEKGSTTIETYTILDILN